MPVNIHGKEYTMVDERVAEFHELYPNGSIISSMSQKDDMFIFKSTATPDVDKPERFFTGHAYEIIGSTQINKTSALENCETSAIGRCLGFLNIGLNGIATADEVANAIHQQKPKPLTLKQAETILDLNQHEAIDGEFADRLDKWIKTDEEHSYEEGEKVIKKMQSRIDEYDGLEE